MIIVIDYDNDAIRLCDDTRYEIYVFRPVKEIKMIQSILTLVFNQLDKDVTVMKQDDGQMHHVDSFSFDWN